MLRRTSPALSRESVRWLLGLLALALLAGCSAPLQPKSAEDQSEPPRLGFCYRLTPADTAEPSSDVEPVSCSTTHTAQTFAIGTLPKSTGDAWDAPAHGKWVFPTCEKAFEKFLSADESLAMRIQLSWVWFRPSEDAWDDGARWYRCDVVGGAPDAHAEPEVFRPLPKTARGLFKARPPEEWLTCARGATVSDGERVPCSEDHDWRAVTTIKLGEPGDPYPGERLVQVRSRDYCSDSVGAWMNYPVDYDFAFTAFHAAEWKAGNRRTICWAKTDR